MKARLTAFGYVLLRGLRGMGQSPLVQLLAIGTMAVCMLMLGTVTLIFDNAQGLASRWGVDVPVTVYMVDGVDASQVTQLQDRLQRLPEVTEVELISPELAMDRLGEGLGADSDLLEGIEAESLPHSLEVHLRRDVEPAFADALASRLDDFEEVDEVATLGGWVAQAQSLLDTLRNLAVGVGLLVSLACVAIVWSTIRLGVFARRAEIQILRLVGGTSVFVRGPFLVEGLLQGLLGSGLALGMLWLAFEMLQPYFDQGLSLLFAAGAVHFFSPLEMIVALGFGCLLGVVGSRAAVGRYVEI